MNTLWNNSLELMLLGMSSVFVFLTLLVIVTTLMSKVIMLLNRKNSIQEQATMPAEEADIVAVAVTALLHSKKP